MTQPDFIGAMNWIVNSNKKGHLKWHYLQSRPIELDMKFPKNIDCSGTATFIYRMLGLKDPNGFNYSGAGYTGTLIAKGKQVTIAQATIGDIVIYGAGNGDHAAVLAQNGSEHPDPITLSMGQEGDPSWVKISQDGRPHRIFTYDKVTRILPPYDFSTFDPPFQSCHPNKPKQKMERATIKLGSKGEDVKYLQTKLALTADGVFSIMTDKAVKIFQQKNKLVVDGIVGPNTWKVLG